MLELKLYPDKILSERAVEYTDEELTGASLAEVEKLAIDMRETMLAFGGMGLAGNQVGVAKRIIVLAIPGADDLAVLINPVITDRSEETDSFQEGCLSFPGALVSVERPVRITVQFRDVSGAHQERTLDGLAAVGVQHELDHLDGVLMINRVSPLKRRFALKKLAKLKKRLALREKNAQSTAA